VGEEIDRMNRKNIGATLLVLGASLSLLSCGTPGLTPTPTVSLRPTIDFSTQPTVAPARSVTYSVTGLDGGKRASLTYANAQGGTEQTTVTLPWTKTFTATKGQFLYIAAQNQDAFGGVSCDITIGGTAFKHSESRGEYVIASCDGSAP